jgi:hypothetical protein
VRARTAAAFDDRYSKPINLTRRFTMKLPRRVLGLLTGTMLFSTAVFARTLDGMNNRTGMMNL